MRERKRFWVQDAGCRVQGSGLRMQGVEFIVQGLGLNIKC